MLLEGVDDIERNRLRIAPFDHVPGEEPQQFSALKQSHRRTAGWDLATQFTDSLHRIGILARKDGSNTVRSMLGLEPQQRTGTGSTCSTSTDTVDDDEGRGPIGRQKKNSPQEIGERQATIFCDHRW